MNNRFIKIILFSIFCLFIASLVLEIILNKKDDKIIETQIDVSHNLTLNQDMRLKLNNAFRSIYVNYDKLLQANKVLKKNTEDLANKNLKNHKIQNIKHIVYKQDNNIDIIKRTNSLITNSFQFIKFSHVNNPMMYTNITQELLDLSYEIKLLDYTLLDLYEAEINKFKLLNINHDLEKGYKESMIVHSKLILHNSRLLEKNINEFNAYQKELSDIYSVLRSDMTKEHALLKSQMKYIRIILVLLLFVLLFLVLKFFILELKHKKEEKKLQNIIDKHIIMETVNSEGITQKVSSAYQNISGYLAQELEGKENFTMKYSPYAKDIQDTLKLGKIWKGEIFDTNKDGELYRISTVIEPIYDDSNNVKYYLVIRHDITNNMRLEELTKNQEEIIESQIKIANEERDKAVKASQSKSEFLANMSHEIRTPLNSIGGFIDILLKDEKNQTKQEYLEIINNSSNNLMNIINDILDFSKIESGKLVIDKIDFDSQIEFNLLVKSFESCFKEKGIHFISSFENLPQVINGDLLRIRQVLNNLLSNAYKFTNKNKSVFLKISYDDTLLNFTVEDEGIGMSIKYQEHIFDAFSQEDSSTTRKYGGTGLGLSISCNLVNLMGGKLNVNSIVDKGSKFTFSLPIEYKELALKEINEKQDILFYGHVLLVEDNKANQMFMKVIFKKIGLTFEIAHDGLEAIKMFKNKKYDLILMDENMPNMSGIEATKAIIELEHKTNLKHTPIIALTANAILGDKERFLDSGMDDYLSKPLKQNVLNKVLKKFLISKKAKND